MQCSRTLAGIVFTAASACAQISPPGFEVASVKLNTRCDTSDLSGGISTPGRIALECADLRDLILTAYGIYGNGANPASGSFRMQVVGCPWRILKSCGDGSLIQPTTMSPPLVGIEV